MARKQCIQHETPERSLRELSKRGAETIYWGKKPCQTKVYDKTGHRLSELQVKRRKMTRSERDALTLETHFEREYGYSIFKPVTRFERQLGDRESGRVFGIDKFGEIKKAPFIDPFERMEFPEQAHEKGTGRIPRMMDEFSILYLKDLIERDGLTNARNAMIRMWGHKAFYRRYKLILPLLLPAGTGPTREQVRKAYVESTLKQFAA